MTLGDQDDAEARASFQLELRTSGVRSIDVLRIMERVSRSYFVPAPFAHLATRNLALPLACGQTMSEPLHAARLLEAADCRPGSHVLEIGTGSGYVTALLAGLSAKVRTVERFRTLADLAQHKFAMLELRNIDPAWDDGFAPQPDLYDRIVVNGVVDVAPKTLLDRLKPDGSLLLGFRRATDPAPGRSMPRLVRITKTGTGLETRDCFPCRLQPMLAGKSKTL